MAPRQSRRRLRAIGRSHKNGSLRTARPGAPTKVTPLPGSSTAAAGPGAPDTPLHRSSVRPLRLDQSAGCRLPDDFARHDKEKRTLERSSPEPLPGDRKDKRRNPASSAPGAVPGRETLLRIRTYWGRPLPPRRHRTVDTTPGACGTAGATRDDKGLNLPAPSLGLPAPGSEMCAAIRCADPREESTAIPLVRATTGLQYLHCSVVDSLIPT